MIVWHFLSTKFYSTSSDGEGFIYYLHINAPTHASKCIFSIIVVFFELELPWCILGSKYHIMRYIDDTKFTWINDLSISMKLYLKYWLIKNSGLLSRYTISRYKSGNVLKEGVWIICLSGAHLELCVFCFCSSEQYNPNNSGCIEQVHYLFFQSAIFLDIITYSGSS